MYNFENILKTYIPKPLGTQHEYSVLLPLIYENEEWYVLFEVRSEHISQPGEVAFPGGSVEKNETFKDAAVRETVEELNLDPKQIQIFGEIDYVVNAKNSIHCFVGQLLVDNWRAIQFNTEVARLFTIPLSLLIDHPPRYYRLTTNVKMTEEFPFNRIRNGVNYKFSSYHRSIPFYDITDENIWGLTAQFTHRFTEIIKEFKLN